MSGKIARAVATGAAIAFIVGATSARAEKKYGPGVTDTEIVLGQTMAFSGPASAYSAIGKTEAAYFKMINDRGGINGRKITLIAYDDAYSPPKTVEQVRKLVESDNVLALFSVLGTPPNAAIQKYANTKKVPQVFASTGATRFQDPKNYPWTIGFNPNYQSEARVYAKYILENHPDAKIGILYANDDLGKDYVVGIKDGLGAKANQIVGALSYELSDPTIDSQIVRLKSIGADVFLNIATPKFAAQAIKKAHELNWNPVQFLTLNSISVSGTLIPGGLEASKGIISVSYLKEPLDPALKDDAGLKEYFEFMAKYYPEGDKDSAFNIYGYAITALMAKVIENCGDDLTRENLMRQATTLKNVTTPMHLPGITITTTPTDYRVNKQFYMMRFNGERWERFGEKIEDVVPQSSN
ncbi:MAG: ABC transporter substrate-binding protein [Xanthobacteraceae bacterium]